MLEYLVSLSVLATVALSADLCYQECTSDKQEVCASDGNTYINPCQFGIESCRAHQKNQVLYEVHTGACSGQGIHTQLRACTQICNEELKPVCASNNQVYGNKCKFQRAQCELANEGQHLAMVSTLTTRCPVPTALNCTKYEVDLGGIAIEQSGGNPITCPKKPHHHGTPTTYVCASNNKNYHDECAVCHHREQLKAWVNRPTQEKNLMILHEGRCQQGVSYNPFGVVIG